MNKEQVKTFADNAKIQATDACMISRCVDGRYEGLENFPVIAKPGGDVGDVMTALAAINLLDSDASTEEVLKIVVDAVGGTDKFNFHTDNHAEQDQLGAGQGCGHIKLAKQNAEAYGLKQDQIDLVVSKLPELKHQGAHQEVLHGDHAEQAVVVVDSENYGLKPLVHGADGTVVEAFIYQKTLHNKQLDKLALEMAAQLFGDGSKTIEQVRESLTKGFNIQLTETLSRLANGLPVYEVHIDNQGVVTVK